MAYERINWQNEPSEATALNDVNLNKMDSAIYELDGKATATDTAITALQDGKVDKVNGKGLSQVDSVTVTQHVAYGTVVSTIKTYGQDGTEVTSQVCNGIVVDSALSNSSTNPVQNKVVKSAIDGKSTVAISDTLADGDTIANVTIDGVTTPIKASQPKSEEMNVRSAMMLLTPPISNNAPYVKRVVGGGIINPYLCKLKKLIGASVVWNQLVQNPTTVLTIQAGTNNPAKVQQNLNLVAEHKYLFSYKQNNAVTSNTRNTPYFHDTTNRVYLDGSNRNLSAGVYTWVFTPQSTVSDGYVGIWGYALSDNTTYTNFVLTDLTAMFGSTIADYVNTLETQTAGSGVAWLKSYGFFTEDYYAYSANTMQSVSVSAKRNASINLWNEKWEIGNYNTNTGEKGSGTTTIRSVDKITVKGGYTYYFKIPAIGIRIFRYNGNTFDGTEVIASSGKWVCPSNVNAITFQKGGTLTYDNDICINESNESINGRYFPYFEPSEYPLDHTELRGLFKLDANNNLYADGDEYTSDGSGDVKYAVMEFDGSNDESWTYQYECFNIIISDSLKIQTPLCNKYVALSSRNLTTLSNGECAFSNTGYNYFNIKTDVASDVASFRTWLSSNHIVLVYELATPTTAELTPFTELQNIENGGIEEFIDYGVEQGTRDVAIPCGQKSEYNSGVVIPNLPTSGGKVELTYNPTNGQFTWE